MVGPLLPSQYKFFSATKNHFLKADPETTARLRKKYKVLGDKKLVGLAWYTQSRVWSADRSVELPELLAALPLDDIIIIDVQYGDTAGAWQQAQKMFPNLNVMRDPEVDQFQDMDIYTAQMAACDVVLTICNTTSHVAGALGVPAVVLMPNAGLTWYWFEKGEVCPWYPSLKLLAAMMCQIALKPKRLSHR